MGTTDVVIVGAGILGLTSARALLRRDPDRRIVVLEKEAAPAAHQTGHNSGVIHSGIYYRPDSGKAALVASGRTELLAFLERHEIPHEMCGKVVVAVADDEVARLDALESRAVANQVETERLDRAGLRTHEPHIEGVAALRVPSAGIVDYGEVCRALVHELIEAGVELRLGTRVTGTSQAVDHIRVDTDHGALRTRSLINCGGLHSDRVAAATGADTGGIRIMPFRGEYYELAPHARHLVNDLVYPLPDPDFPFLGVHLTRLIDGSIHAGPNAVPALAREGYRWRDISVRDSAEIARSRRTWILARKYWRTEMGEIHRSLSRRAFLAALRRLCPDLTDDDLVRSSAGVRAQAIAPDGTLLDDFAFAEGPRAVHVLNAPSPAATASFAIAETVADRHARVMSAEVG